MLTTTNFRYIKYFYRRSFLLLFISTILLPAFSLAQSTTVSGHITGNNGLPIAGVSVQEQNTSTGTATNNTGDFSLTVSNPNAVLEISSLGYASQTISLNGRTTINVTLAGSATQLEQVVVVIGYGTQKKKDLTGASASIKGSEIANVPVLTATQAIQKSCRSTDHQQRCARKYA